MKMKNNREPNIIFKERSINYNYFAGEFLLKTLIKFQKESKGKISVALSGGSTPLPILEILMTKKLDWERFNFFMVDERCVSLENSSSNYGNIYKIFFNKIQSNNYSMVQEGLSFNESIKKYKKDIIENVAIGENGFPKFDLILLGMGDDGHTASLFPNTNALIEKNEVAVINKVPQLKTERITLTYPTILNAIEIIVMVKGENKEEIISELYSSSSKKYPMLKIVEEHSNLKWLIG
jgi:6-phosphogluconolactonase